MLNNDKVDYTRLTTIALNQAHEALAKGVHNTATRRFYEQRIQAANELLSSHCEVPKSKYLRAIGDYQRDFGSTL